MLKEVDAARIDKVLRSKYCNNKYNLSNSYVYKWECDFFTMSASGYAYEIEVKVSRADFRKDFTKVKKHKLLNDPNSVTYHGGGPYKVPNKFYYCVPEGLIKLEEIPPYAGLIYTNGFTHNEVKPAPFIHKTKHDLTKVLLEKFYFLSMDLQHKIAVGQRNFNF